MSVVSATPKFGDLVTNNWASMDNPCRVGIFVRAGHRPKGQMNSGPWWELTNGKGDFWEMTPSNCTVAHQLITFLDATDIGR